MQFVVMGSGPSLDMRANGPFGVRNVHRSVDDTTLFKVLSTADVCINPDRPNALNDLSTMNKIMEYMALGKPIVQFALTEGCVSAQSASLYARNTGTAPEPRGPAGF